ncbi:MAG: hypothetical protein MI700_11850, partial [Balneolales bacterium]|nr:hypothetical protein [Balneolales bacterium]
GMAKPAELNGYPGPKHVIDAYESGELDLTDIQFEKIQAQFLEMQNLAIPLGEKLVAVELEIEEAFQNKTITQELLQSHIAESAGLYAQLRVLHMSYHLKMIDILSPDQISQYNILRGYSNETNPCENVPEGHDPQMWKLHNNCN